MLCRSKLLPGLLHLYTKDLKHKIFHLLFKNNKIKVDVSTKQKIKWIMNPLTQLFRGDSPKLKLCAGVSSPSEMFACWGNLTPRAAPLCKQAWSQNSSWDTCWVSGYRVWEICINRVMQGEPLNSYCLNQIRIKAVYWFVNDEKLQLISEQYIHNQYQQYDKTTTLDTYKMSTNTYKFLDALL